MARIVRRLQDLPGQDLFEYVNETGAVESVSSADVNTYLKEAMSEGFTAKDFRTWWGSLLTLLELEDCDAPESKAQARRSIARAIKSVAARLGNTPAVCRKSYVHPVVLEKFRSGNLPQTSGDQSPEERIRHGECRLLDIIESSPQ